MKLTENIFKKIFNKVLFEMADEGERKKRLPHPPGIKTSGEQLLPGYQNILNAPPSRYDKETEHLGGKIQFPKGTWTGKRFNEINFSIFETIEGIDFTGSSFFKCIFTGATFQNCKMSNCTFQHRNPRHTVNSAPGKFVSCDMRNSRFLDVNFGNGFRFDGCNLDNSVFSDNSTLGGAIANTVNFEGFSNRGSSLRGVDFTNTILRNFRYDEDKIDDNTLFGGSPLITGMTVPEGGEMIRGPKKTTLVRPLSTGGTEVSGHFRQNTYLGPEKDTSKDVSVRTFDKKFDLT